ncbi:MAG: 50S ribosomal protein L25 [Anaerolineae bacterium]|nr:50S ribosomal protein L25 [Anaerolineae bacterium]
MTDFSLEAQPRTVTGKKVGQLRRNGLVPMTVYGPKTQPVNLQVAYRPLEILLSKAGGTNLIDINADGKTYTVLVREVQRDVITRKMIHIDLFALDLTAKLKTDIPVRYVGESPAVQAKQGVLITGPSSLHVELLPSALMEYIEIDIASLKTVGAAIFVGDLKLGEGIAILNDPEELLARVSQTSAARSEVDEAMEEAGSVEPEVISKGKAEEEDF